MKAENEAAAAEDMKKELEELKQRCKKLKVLCKLLNLCSDFIPTSNSVLAHLFSLATN
jgi:archaellum component FlaC